MDEKMKLFTLRFTESATYESTIVAFSPEEAWDIFQKAGHWMRKDRVARPEQTLLSVEEIPWEPK